MFGIGFSPMGILELGVLLYIVGIIIKNNELKSIGSTVAIVGIVWYLFTMFF